MIVELSKGTKNNYTSVVRIDKDAGIVEKIIDYDNLSAELFERELYWLNKLAHTGLVPRVLNSDKISNSITMEWCGDVLSEHNKPSDVYYQLYKISIMLLKNGCLYNDWKYGNFLVKNSKVTIIDFGWCPKIIEDYTCGCNIESEIHVKPGGGNLFENVLKESNA